MSAERWLGPKQIAEKCSVSRETGRRWIIRIMERNKGMTPKNKGRGKRPYHLRRIPESLLEKYLPELLNG